MLLPPIPTVDAGDPLAGTRLRLDALNRLWFLDHGPAATEAERKPYRLVERRTYGDDSGLWGPADEGGA